MIALSELIDRLHHTTTTLQEELARLRAEAADVEHGTKAEELLERALDGLGAALDGLRSADAQVASLHFERSEAARRLREMVAVAPVGYLELESEGRIVDANGAASSLFGVSRESLIGATLAEFVSEEQRPAVTDWLATQVSRPNGASQREIDIRRGQDGRAVVWMTTSRSTNGSSSPRLRALITPNGHESDHATLPAIATLGDVGRLADEAISVSQVALDPDSVLAALFQEGRRIPVIVINHQQMFVRGLEMILEHLLGNAVDVVATTADASEGYRLVQQHQPRLVLIDTSGQQNLDLLKQLSQDFPEVAFLALTAGPEEASGWAALEHGATGILPKSTAPERAVGPLLAVADGWMTVPSGLGAHVSDWAVRRQALYESLTDEEVDLLTRVAHGMTDDQIAQQMYVSSRTVKRRVAALFRKLDVDGRVEAAALAGVAGLSEEPPPEAHMESN